MENTIAFKSDEKKTQTVSLIKCLSDCDKGEELTVISVQAGHTAKRRLANLGIVPGIKIIKKREAPFRGPLEIIVKGTNLVIGRGLASKIYVKCATSCNL